MRVPFLWALGALTLMSLTATDALAAQANNSSFRYSPAKSQFVYQPTPRPPSPPPIKTCIPSQRPCPTCPTIPGRCY
jgi:hypothetical protein